jgi:hypothetical protein
MFRLIPDSSGRYPELFNSAFLKGVKHVYLCIQFLE